MKVHFTIVYEYEIPDDMNARRSIYGGIVDPDYCVAIDIENGFQEISEFAEIIHTEYKLIP